MSKSLLDSLGFILELLSDIIAMIRVKCLENEFFPDQGKVGKFCGWSGKFEREESGNLEIYG